ncbi:MAG: Uncharacterised protein [Flavobacteriaceae bacterium]|nr:MAG: Uncharacterised protein [Flavobacteriaceae bacterium]
MTPINWFLENTILNNTAPKIKVTIGVVEFKIEATALSIWVSAKANRNAGIKVPRNPDTTIHFHSCFRIFFKDLNPISNKKIAANKVRKAPNCKGVKPTNAFLINIKELPQTTERIIKYNHFLSIPFITTKVRLNIEV